MALGAFTVTPATVTISASGAAHVPKTADITVSENQFLGYFRSSSSNEAVCTVVVKNGVDDDWQPAIGLGPSALFSVFSQAAGTATMTFTDTDNNSGTCVVTVNV